MKNSTHDSFFRIFIANQDLSAIQRVFWERSFKDMIKHSKIAN